MEWTRNGTAPASLVVGDDARVGQKAERWEAEAGDGCRLEALALGDGSAKSPHIIHVRCYSPDGEDGKARHPYLEEVQSAVNLITLQGAIMSMGVLRSFGADSAPAPAIGWAGVMTAQVAGVDGSPASHRLKLTGGLSLVGNRNGGGPHGEA